MAGPDDEAESSAWLVEPPGADQIHLTIGIGENVEMTPELRTKIEALVASVTGAATSRATLEENVLGRCGGVFDRCGTFSCSLDECLPLKIRPCKSYLTCQIDKDR